MKQQLLLEADEQRQTLIATNKQLQTLLDQEKKLHTTSSLDTTKEQNYLQTIQQLQSQL